MTRMDWNATGERYFETGVDRGVLYLSDIDGVPWNGLVSVSESPSGGEAKPYYMDGIKYLNIAAREEFEATLEAFSSPAEFGVCDGTVSIQNGLFVTQQPRRAFGLSYRTKIGNDLDGPDHAYKIHLVYNALAAPSERAHSTLADSPEAETLSWAITTLPPSFTGYKPTSHFVIDSRYTPDGLLQAIEDILYGSDVADARLPMPSELISMFQSQGPVRRTNIIDNPNMLDLNGTVTVRTNLSVNPAYKSVFAAAEVRRNLATNPSCETTSGWLSNNTGSWTMSQDSAVKRSGTYSMKSTPTAATIGASRTLGSIYQAGGGVFPCAANDLITASCYVAHNAGQNAEANIFVQFLDSGGAVLSTLNQNVWVAIGAGNSTFTRIKYSATAAPANTATVRVLVNVQKVTGSVNVAANEFCWFDDCLVEKANVMLPYFDGTTAAALGLTYSWTGTAHASASIASGAQPNNASVKGYARPIWVVTGGATDGSNTMRSYLGSSSVANLGPNTLVLFGYDTPAVVAGETATARFRARLINATASLTLSSRLFGYTSGGAGVSQFSAPTNTVIPADGSWVDVLVPAGVAPATTAQGRIYCTGTLSELQNDAIIEVSNVMVEKAEVQFSWFDGNSAAADGLTYSFTGTANASTSVATGAAPRGWTVAAPDSIYAAPNGGAYLRHPVTNSISASHYTDTVNEGETYTSAATFENPSDGYGPKTCYLAMRTYDASGNNLVWTESTRYTLNPGESKRISMTITIQPGEAQLRTYLHANGPGRCKLSQVLCNQGTRDDYFDGSTPNADGYFYAWSSVVNNSRSTVSSWYLN